MEDGVHAIAEITTGCTILAAGVPAESLKAGLKAYALAHAQQGVSRGTVRFVEHDQKLEDQAPGIVVQANEAYSVVTAYRVHAKSRISSWLDSAPERLATYGIVLLPGYQDVEKPEISVEVPITDPDEEADDDYVPSDQEDEIEEIEEIEETEEELLVAAMGG